jgi:hypothetical protein
MENRGVNVEGAADLRGHIAAPVMREARIAVPASGSACFHSGLV